MRRRVTVVGCVCVCVSTSILQTVTNQPVRPTDHLSAAINWFKMCFFVKQPHKHTLRSLFVLLADSETTMFVSDNYMHMYVSSSIDSNIGVFVKYVEWIFEPKFSILLALLILGIPLKIEKIMKDPDQWSVKPICKHYCINVSLSGYTFTSFRKLHVLYEHSTFTSFPGLHVLYEHSTFTFPQATCVVWALHFHLFSQATCVVWVLQLNIQYTSIANYGDIVEANYYVHCDNWRIDLDEHVHSSFVRSWRRPMWPKHSAISYYCLIDSAMYVLIKIYSPTRTVVYRLL